MNLSFTAMICLLVSVLSFVPFAAQNAHAQETLGYEKVGRLTVEEVLLRPTYISTEIKGGEFSLSDSSFKIRWQKDQNLSATVGVGSILERGIPAYYLSTTPDDALGFYEVYADYQGLYGRLRAGLQPLNFGFYGAQPGAERIFQRPLIYQNRIIGLRDYGVSFYTGHNGFYTELIGHNGEVDHKPNDGNLWVTARWGWSNERNLRVQVSAQTGRTKPVSTAEGDSTLAGWNRADSARWRFGALSVNWFPRRWEVTAQVMAGEREQESSEGGIFSAQLEVINYIGDRWGWGLRHDEFDPNDKQSGDKQMQVSGLLFVKSDDSTSLFSIVISKNLEEINQQSNDQVLLGWRLTPYIGR